MVQVKKVANHICFYDPSEKEVFDNIPVILEKKPCDDKLEMRK